MNKFIFMGRLTRDPEVRYTNEGMCVSKFSIAIDRKKDEAADFMPITAFGKVGEFTEKFLKKGTKILVTGTIQNNNYTDNTGVKHYGFTFIASEIEFAESKRANETNTAAEPASCGDGFMNVPDGIDENLPFAAPRR